jgi:hypothetical protein
MYIAFYVTASRLMQCIGNSVKSYAEMPGECTVHLVYQCTEPVYTGRYLDQKQHIFHLISLHCVSKYV